MPQLGESFRYEIVEGDGTANVTFDGVLNEFVQLSLIKVDAKRVILDLGGVQQLNSVGVRELRNFMAALKGRDVRVVACSQAVVSQLSLVADILGSAEIVSFHVPLFCESCDRERDFLIETASYFACGLQPPSCDGCGETMIFDGENHFEDFYFSFLANRTPPPDPDY